MNVVHLCDCMDFMRGLSDKAYDLAIVDPPYRENNKPTLWMKKLSDMKSFGGKPNEKYFNELKRISNNQIIWGANNFSIIFEGFIVWDKKIRGSRKYY